MLARVLGALEIDGAGGPVGVGGPVPRRILTALLARPGATVSVDALIDAAWGDDPPPSAERSVQSHITRLREGLSALDPAPVIERRPGGYALTAEPDCVDALRFERLVVAAADADPTGAVPSLREALGLWRTATPYADLQDTAYPEAEAARLVEMRGSAADALAAALLASGDSAAAAAESEARLRDDPYREGLWETLVVALYRQGRQADALAAYRRARRELDDGLGIEPGPRLRQIEAQVLAQDPALLNGHASRTRHPCPYKGLARYEESDADLYVGRERLVEELLARLVDTRFLVVVGPSGAGKSSLVRAGLASALAAGALPGSDTWVTQVIVPGSSPVEALETALADRPQLVVVDQAEEALLADDGAHVAAFGDRVLAAVDGGTRLVLALRADFYGRLAEHTALARRVGPATVLVGPPDDDELRRIVTEPASRVGLRVEPALADLVVSEVRGRPGVLPVLSTALVRTWEHRDGDELTVAAYRAGGGVEAALQRVGDEAWSALEDDEQRAACRRMLLRLADFEDGQWVRRRARRIEVTPPGDGAAAAALAVLADRRLVVAGSDDVEIAHEALLTGWPRLRGWLEDGRAHADVRHRLTAAATEWDAGGRDDSELYAGTRLQAALDTQAASPQDVSPLELEFLAQSQAAAERALVEQRQRADDEAKRRRRTRAVALGLAAALVVAAGAGGFAVHQQQVAASSAAAARSAALHADATRLGAQSQGRNRYDLSLLLAAQAYRLEPSVQTQSTLLSVLQEGDAVRAVREFEGIATGMAVSPDGRTVVIATDCGSITGWPVATIGTATPEALYDNEGSCEPRSVAFAPDGTLIAGLYGTVGAMSRVGELHDRAGTLSEGAWALSPDGREFAALEVTDDRQYGTDLVLGAVDGRGPATRVPLRAAGVWAGRCGDLVCVTTDQGHLLRFTFGAGAPVSDVRLEGAPLLSTTIDTEVIPRFVVDPAGLTIAVPSSDHRVRLNDLATGRVVRVLPGTTDDGRALSFSPDGTLLAGRDGATVLLWHLTGDATPERLVGHAGRVGAAVFAAGGSQLVTTSEDHALIAWDVSGKQRFGKVLTRDMGGVDGKVVSTMWAAGTRIAVGHRDGTVQLVDPITGSVSGPVGGDPSPGKVALPTIRSGYGSDHAIVAATDGLTTLWSLSTGQLVSRIDLPPEEQNYGVETWVSADGKWAATYRSSTGVSIIDMADGRVVRTLQPLPSTPYTVFWHDVFGWTADGSEVLVRRQTNDPQGADIFALDATTGAVRARAYLESWPEEVAADMQGRFVATGGDDGLLVFLDPSTLRPFGPRAQAGSGLQIYNVGSSPDGRWLSTSGGPPWASLWDAATRTQVGGPFAVDGDARDARARWTGDGRLVVLSGATLRIYEIDPAVWLARACREAGRTLTRDEWERYLPGRPYDPSCTTAAATGAVPVS